MMMSRLFWILIMPFVGLSLAGCNGAVTTEDDTDASPRPVVTEKQQQLVEVLHSPMRAALRPPAVAGCRSSCQLPMLPMRANPGSRRCTYDRRQPTLGVDCAAAMRKRKG